jgi:hypothetical protein
MIDTLIDLFLLPMDNLKLSGGDLKTTLNYHKRIARLAEADVDSSCGPVRRMILVTCAEATQARYIGYTLNGKQIIEEVQL